MSYSPPPLTAAELAVLRDIAAEIRASTAGLATGRTTLASILAGRMGRKVGPSLRALVALPDLNRPKPSTLEALAVAIRRPELAERWLSAWAAVDHPRSEVPDAPQA